MAVGVYVVSFSVVKANGRGGAGAEGGGVFVRERGWAVQMERWEEEEGVPILFALAGFGLRMSCFFFYYYFGGGVEKLNAEELFRNGAKRP